MKVINILNKKANRNIPKRIINWDRIVIEDLNEEVVIIEDAPKEDKKYIEHIKMQENILHNDLNIIDKLNEIIDRLNGEDNEEN